MYRRNWYWLALLALVTVATVALIALATRSRIDANDTQAAAIEKVQFERVQTVADDFFSDAEQLVRIETTTAGRAGDRATVEALLLGTMEARRNRTVYGLGIFFAPRAFDHLTPLYGPYFRMLGNTIGGIHNVSPRSFNYPALHWYKDAASSPGDVVIDGPYTEDGESYVSVMLAFTSHGKLRGVATVDARTDVFLRALTSALRSDQIAYIGGGGGRTLVSTRIPPTAIGDWRDISGPIRFTHSTLHVLGDLRPLRQENGRLVALAVGAAIATCLLALALLAFMLRLWRSREATRASQAREAILQQEIATRTEIEARLRVAAFVDELSGLPNRAFLRDRCATAITAGTPLAMYLIDLDRFSIVNETFGHAAGDEVLQLVADRLRGLKIGTPIRLGGDEFVLLFCDDEPPPDVEAHLLTALQEPFTLRGVEFFLGASVGIVAGGEARAYADEYLRDADIALYEAKRGGRGRAVDFKPEMRQRVSDELALEAELRRALERSEFVAYYQPIIDVASPGISSFEALVRWNGAQRGLIGAEDFVGFAERRGLIAQIDNAMLDIVARDTVTLFQTYPHASVAVNFSAAHLSDARLVADVGSVLENARLTPSQLRIEITETAIMLNAERSLEVLRSLRDFGIEIVVDDFGTGHSSLAYLQRLPISGIKIDRSFISPLASDAKARSIVRSIVALGDALGLFVVAEGVEDERQAVQARELGIRYLQGYFFARPLPVSAIATYQFSNDAQLLLR